MSFIVLLLAVDTIQIIHNAIIKYGGLNTIISKNEF